MTASVTVSLSAVPYREVVTVSTWWRTRATRRRVITPLRDDVTFAADVEQSFDDMVDDTAGVVLTAVPGRVDGVPPRARSTHRAASTDGRAVVTVTVDDDDTAGVTVVPGLRVDEGGAGYLHGGVG